MGDSPTTMKIPVAQERALCLIKGGHPLPSRSVVVRKLWRKGLVLDDGSLTSEGNDYCVRFPYAGLSQQPDGSFEKWCFLGLFESPEQGRMNPECNFTTDLTDAARIMVEASGMEPDA